MSTLPQQRPTQGVAPELSSRCAGCGVALAPDQLFCLSCGTRRRDARIAFRDVLASEAAPVHLGGAGGTGAGGPGTSVAVSPPAGQAGGPTSYTPFVATLAMLLLALGVGVWIGRGQEAPAAVAAPVAAAPVAAAAAPTTPADAAAPTEDDAAAGDDAAAEDDAAEEDPAAADADTGAESPELKKLDDLSPEDYQKQSQKLPKEVGTGGTPPPKDNKPAGGGSEFETFE